MERKFTKSLNRPGMAAQLRETVSQVVKETENQTRLARAEPVDYEAFVTKHRTVMLHEADRDMLLFPLDDISLKSVQRECRTAVPTVSEEMVENSKSVFVRECLKAYLAEWKVVEYKFTYYSGPYLNLPRFPRVQKLKELVYEVDAGSDEADASAVTCESVAKEGYLLKGPEGGGDWLFGNMGSKNLKRRFARLRQTAAGGPYLLEFAKDDQRGRDTKGTIDLDFVREIVRAPRRGKLAFEIRTGTGAGRKNYLLSAETEDDLMDWLDKLGKVIEQNGKQQEVGAGKAVDKGPAIPHSSSSDLGFEISEANYGTLRGLDQSLNPELTKYAKETEVSIAHKRGEERESLFLLYPDMPKNPVEEPPSLEDQAPPWKEGHGRGLRVAFKDVKLHFKLAFGGNPSSPTVGASPGSSSPTMPVEPYFTSVALFDAVSGVKMSEDFHFDPNTGRILETIDRGTRTSAEEISSALPHLKGVSIEWMSSPCQAIFSVMGSSRADIYIVLRIEKVLQGGVVSVSEPYLKNPNHKSAEKVQKAFQTFGQRLGQYRMPFAWATCPLFSLNGKLDTSERTLSLYRIDPCKFSDADIVRLLPEVKRVDKESRFSRIPGYFSFRLERVHEPAPNTLTSSLMPVEPFPLPPGCPMSIEVQDFPSNRVEHSSPHLSLFNLLYVYPLSLKYDGQKVFARARNLACSVQLRDSDAASSQPLLAAVGRSTDSLLNTRVLSPVLHHSPNPDFYLEAKFLLPPEVGPNMHLVFTFYHVSCEPAKKKEKDSVEAVVGYAWLPLLENGRLNIGDHQLSVAAALPPGYLSVEHFGLGKGFSGPELKWVDNQKPLFTVRLSAVSSVYCPDPHLHAFFTQLALNSSGGSQSGSDAVSSLSNGTREVSKFVKALHAVEPCWLLRYLQPLLCRLFSLLLAYPNDEDVQLSVAKTAVHVVHQAEMAEHQDTMLAYTKFVFDLDALASANPSGTGSSDGITLHEQLCRALTLLLRPANTDPLVINKFLRHTGFFLRLLAKAMAQYLLTTGRIKMQRHERFSGDFHYRLQSLLQALSPHIIQKHKELPAETREANFCVSHFVKKCLSLTDRGMTFRLIAFYMEKFGPGDPHLLQEFKFDFIREIVSHEHYVALNLPFIPGKKTKEEMASKFVLTPDFLSQHYLSGVLLKELKFALNELPTTRRLAVNILRNLLAKHSFDDRYQAESQQGRIAMLYLPLITIVLENVGRLDMSEPVNGKPGQNQWQESHNRAPSSALSFAESTLSSASTLSSRSSIVDSISIPSESSVLDMIAGGSTLPAGCKLTATGSLVRQIPAPTTPVGSVRFRRHHRGSESTLTNGSIGGASDMTINEEDEDAETGDVKKEPEGLDEDDDDTPTPTGASPAVMRSPSSVSQKSSSHQRVPSMVTAQNFRKDKLTPAEVKDLLLCFLWLVKHVPQDFILAWWKHAVNDDIWAFFRVLELSLKEFRYKGKAASASNMHPSSPLRNPTAFSAASSTSSSRIGSWRSGSVDMGTIGDAGDTLRSTSSMPSSPFHAAMLGTNCSSASSGGVNVDGSAFHSQHSLEGHLSAEVAMITLDCLGLYSLHFQSRLLADCGTGVGRNDLMKKSFDIYLYFLQASQAEPIMDHVFAAWRVFLNTYSATAMFGGNGDLCGRLCFELLKACNSRLASVRSNAAAVLYLLMRANFELSQRKAMTRVHLQVIIGVSRLLGEVVSLNNARFQESLSRLNSLASADSAMRHTGLRAAVADVTHRVRSVLMATSQLREAAADAETMADLQLRLAASYAATPQLRQTWLESLARVHARAGHASEVAMCHIHVAALMAEVLRHARGRGGVGIGANDFARISPNVPMEEKLQQEEATAEMQEIPYTEDTVVEELSKAVEWFEKAERWECLAEVFRLIIPFHEAKRDFAALADCYSRLQYACRKVADPNYSRRRLLGTYFRVAFYGEGFFDAMSGKSFLYKEPKVTSLAEFSERIRNLFSDKFGHGAVKIIQDSAPVNLDDLDPQMAHIQITHVVPYFDDSELTGRVTDFEKNHNICRFVFETPFTVEGKSARGKIEDQWKRKTILTTSRSLPYMSKRIEVITQEIEELSPIEVAVEEMTSRVAGLKAVLSATPPDIKRLQLVLQGSISVQVNAGPLAYAQSFLNAEAEDTYPAAQVAMLKEIFRQFLAVSGAALDLNGRLISSEQRDYQEALKQSYVRLRTSLAVLIGGGIGAVSSSSTLRSDTSSLGRTVSLDTRSSAGSDSRLSVHSLPSNRASSTLFSVISGTSGSSEA